MGCRARCIAYRDVRGRRARRPSVRAGVAGVRSGGCRALHGARWLCGRVRDQSRPHDPDGRAVRRVPAGSRAGDDRRRAPQARRRRAKRARSVLPARKGTARSWRRADTAAGSRGGPAPGVDPGWFATHKPWHGREHLSPAPPRPAARRRARHGSGTRIGVGASAGTLRCARTSELHATPGRDLAHHRGSHGPRRSRSRCRLGESLGVARIRPACRHGATSRCRPAMRCTCQ